MVRSSSGDRGGNSAASATPAMLGGPVESRPDIVSLRWLGTSNFEVSFGGRVVLLDCFYDRGPRMRPLGFGPGDVVRADQIFIGHPHFDHISDAAHVAGQTGALVVGHPIASQVVTAEGLPQRQTLSLSGMADGGDSADFSDYRAHVIHGFHLLSDADEPDPAPNMACSARRACSGRPTSGRSPRRRRRTTPR